MWQSQDSKLKSRACVATRKCSYCLEEAENLLGRNRVHADMLTTQVTMQKIKRTRMFRERKDMIVRVKEASESRVGTGAEKVRAYNTNWQKE